MSPSHEPCPDSASVAVGAERDAAAAMRELRKTRRAARRAVVNGERIRAEQLLTGHVLSVAGLTRPGATVALYQHDDGEPDVSTIIAALHAIGMTIALPILRPANGGAGHVPTAGTTSLAMSFKTWEPGAELQAGTFDLLEPVEGTVLAAQDLSAIIVPLVVFDPSCNRAGRGAGFYDRALGPIRHRADRPLLVGVAFEAQRAANVPRREHDVPMDLIVTELGIRWNPAPTTRSPS